MTCRTWLVSYSCRLSDVRVHVSRWVLVTTGDYAVLLHSVKTRWPVLSGVLQGCQVHFMEHAHQIVNLLPAPGPRFIPGRVLVKSWLYIHSFKMFVYINKFEMQSNSERDFLFTASLPSTNGSQGWAGLKSSTLLRCGLWVVEAWSNRAMPWFLVWLSFCNYFRIIQNPGMN